ncbi:MAG: cache domain-containing protein [Giesbergeria sp.]
MKKIRVLTAAAVVLASAAMTAWANTGGTAAEARAMLEKAATAVKADRAAALSQIAKGEAGFKDRDLYAFCGGADGNYSAHPTLMGKSMANTKGIDGDPIGKKIYDAAKEGSISEVNYMWPKPGATEPSKKISLVTRIGDQVCGVGYYQ